MIAKCHTAEPGSNTSLTKASLPDPSPPAQWIQPAQAYRSVPRLGLWTRVVRTAFSGRPGFGVFFVGGGGSGVQ